MLAVTLADAATSIITPPPEGSPLSILSGILVFVVTTIAWVFAEWRTRHPATIETPSPPMPPAIEMSWDGPVAELKKLLERIASGIERGAIASDDIRSLKNEVGGRVHETRNLMFAEMDKLEARLRDLEKDCAEIKGRLSDYRRPR